MKFSKPLCIIVLLLASRVSLAEPCRYTVEATDQMQYTTRQLSVPDSCSDIEITLKHVGKFPMSVMGHNWVLANSSDINAISMAGVSAGMAQNYQPANDKRILAATKLVGGGDVATVTFSTAALKSGHDYAYFCSFPGHSSTMRGKLSFGDPHQLTAGAKP